MAHTDTTELLKQCDQGVRMGIDAISDMLPKVDDEKLKDLLRKFSDRHNDIKIELDEMLESHGLKSETPNIMAKSMAEMKTDFKMMIKKDDKTAADLMTDGCDMGMKTLTKYLNEYEGAEERAKDMARRIIKIEEDFEKALREYL